MQLVTRHRWDRMLDATLVGKRWTERSSGQRFATEERCSAVSGCVRRAAPARQLRYSRCRQQRRAMAEDFEAILTDGHPNRAGGPLETIVLGRRIACPWRRGACPSRPSAPVVTLPNTGAAGAATVGPFQRRTPDLGSWNVARILFPVADMDEVLVSLASAVSTSSPRR